MEIKAAVFESYLSNINNKTTPNKKDPKMILFIDKCPLQKQIVNRLSSLDSKHFTWFDMNTGSNLKLLALQQIQL